MKAASERGARLANQACYRLFAKESTPEVKQRAACMLPNLRDAKTDFGATMAMRACNQGTP